MSRKGRKNKIEQHGLEQVFAELIRQSKTDEEVTRILNHEYLPPDESVSISTVCRFRNKLPNLKKEVVKQDKRRILKVVNDDMDFVKETKEIYRVAKRMLDEVVEEWDKREELPDPQQMKYVIDSLMKVMELQRKIQKDFYDFDMVKKVIEIVMMTVQEEAPEAMPTIVEKIRASKASWLFDGTVSEESEEQDENIVEVD